MAFKRVCKQLKIPVPHVTISKFDVPQHFVPGQHRPSAMSLLDVLKCSNKKMEPVVMNFIIDGVRVYLTCALHWNRHSHLSVYECVRIAAM